MITFHFFPAFFYQAPDNHQKYSLLQLFDISSVRDNLPPNQPPIVLSSMMAPSQP